MHNLPATNLPEDQRLEFSRVLEILQRCSAEIETRLPLFCILVKQDDIARRVIAIVCLSPTLLIFHDLHTLSSF